jgi:AcrR family transcriptional regulator
VFGKCGFGGARMADIAEAAGVATGTLYNYFDNKGEVFTSMVGLLAKRFIDQARASIDASNSDPMASLTAAVRFTFEYVEAHRATWAIFGELGAVTESDLGHVAGAEVERAYGEWMALLDQVLDAAAAAKLVRTDLPRHALVALLTGICNGFSRGWITTESDPGDLVAQTDIVLDLFLRGAGNHQ